VERTLYACPQWHVALYQRPEGLLKLVIDDRQRLAAIGFVAFHPVRGTSLFGMRWPSNYARDARLAPWFYSLSAKELSYFEVVVAPNEGTDGLIYLGSVALDDRTEFATRSKFPFDEADASTRLDTRGTAVSSTESFAPLRAWRRQAKPNAFVRVAPAGSTGAKTGCDGFDAGRISAADRESLE
jgi:hypothetical protein